MGQLSQHPFLTHLDLEAHAVISDAAREERLARGSVKHCGEDLWLVCTGALVASTGDSTDTSACFVAAAPSALAPAAQPSLHFTVRALEPTTVFVVPEGVMKSVLARSHAFAQALLANQSSLMALCLDQLRQRARFDVQSRLANVLWSYLDLFGVPVADGLLIRVPVSLGQLADAIGVAARTVTRTFETWRSEGWISRRGRRLVIGDVHRLAACLRRGGLSAVHQSGQPPRQCGDELRSPGRLGVSIQADVA